MDPGQFGVRGPARGGGRRADRQRQPITGHLTCPACHPAGAQRCSGPTELGNPAGAADQPDGARRAGLARLGAAAAGVAAQRRQRRVLPGGRGRSGGVGTAGRTGQRRDGRGQHAGGRSAQARRQQSVHRDGCAAERHRSGHRSGARRGHHRAAAVPARRVAARRQEHCRVVAAAGPDGDGRLSDGAAQRQLAVPGTGQRGQRIRPVHAQTRAARGAGQGRLPHRGRHAAEERCDELRAGVGAAVGGRRRDAGDAGQHADRAGRRVPP